MSPPDFNGFVVIPVEPEPTIAPPCGTCSATGWPPGCPPHSNGQHYSAWAGRKLDAAGPAWQVVIDKPLPAGWTPPPGWTDINVFLAALPSDISVVWRKIREAE